jgi:Ca-activated chloride channel family protein
MMSHARRGPYLLAALIGLMGLVQPSIAIQAQEPSPVFKTGVALVPITAVVRDSRNRMVRDLVRDDFHVLENSQPRPIVDFRVTDKSPVSLALLLDTSGSMRGPNFDNAKHVVDGLLNALDQKADEVALFTFDNAIRQETPFTSDPHVIRSALNTTHAWGLTSIYDAIAETAKQLGDQRSHRRAVVVVTDGADTSSTLSPAEVSGIASAIDVPVYVMAVVPPRADDIEAGGGDLSNLAYWTGGALSHVTASKSAESTTGALMAELRQQYFLAIESATASGWHRLDVRTKRRGLTVRARSGYFATNLHQVHSGD